MELPNQQKRAHGSILQTLAHLQEQRRVCYALCDIPVECGWATVVMRKSFVGQLLAGQEERKWWRALRKLDHRIRVAVFGEPSISPHVLVRNSFKDLFHAIDIAFRWD